MLLLHEVNGALRILKLQSSPGQHSSLFLCILWELFGQRKGKSNARGYAVTMVTTTKQPAGGKGQRKILQKLGESGAAWYMVKVLLCLTAAF